VSVALANVEVDRSMYALVEQYPVVEFGIVETCELDCTKGASVLRTAASSNLCELLALPSSRARRSSCFFEIFEE
jgi:hypothetical protein